MAVVSIPHFVVSKTPEGLQQEVIKFQATYALVIDVENIIFANGKWYGWFKIPITRLRDLNGKTIK